ncbi:MAG TPA: alpha/beta fold hydrolase [Thermoleophilaceae bacterium]|jgi:pimeloyl-ACP methyl ester carboxylesterase|nr:alpha/beta fold hydrolase [Thermoleophilaceae bacterium]
MSDSELRALATLGFDELARATGGIGSIQRAVSGRVFRMVGPGAMLVRPVHEGITRGVYRGLGAGTRAVGAAAGRAAARREGLPLSTTPYGSAVIAAIAGLRGDALEEEGSPLAQPMAVRVAGEPVALEPEAIASAFPAATRRIVVFVHGLMTTEFSWALGGRERFGDRLARELGCTPVYVRYNSGRHISENGRSLSELMEQLLAVWPVDVDEIALVGHSMGGLVARSACCHAAEADADWARLIKHSVSLGTPHMGAPLEQAVHVLSAGLARLPETRPFANFLRRRSGGIRDLRQGSLVDEDWRDCDPDALRGAACAEIPLLEGATHCFVSATITRSDRHPVGRLIGDTLVLVPSASGRSRTRRIPFEDEYGMHLGKASHFALLYHPAVYEKLRGWLA